MLADGTKPAVAGRRSRLDPHAVTLRMQPPLDLGHGEVQLVERKACALDLNAAVEATARVAVPQASIDSRGARSQWCRKH